MLFENIAPLIPNSFAHKTRSSKEYPTEVKLAPEKILASRTMLFHVVAIFWLNNTLKYYATLVQKPNIHMEMVKSEAKNSESISGHRELQI